MNTPSFEELAETHPIGLRQEVEDMLADNKSAIAYFLQTGSDFSKQANRLGEFRQLFPGAPKRHLYAQNFLMPDRNDEDLKPNGDYYDHHSQRYAREKPDQFLASIDRALDAAGVPPDEARRLASAEAVTDEERRKLLWAFHILVLQGYNFTDLGA